MWRLKQLMPKDQAGLEGKSVDVGALKLQVRSVIAEGGFSSVYLARDAQTAKNYALKHILCDEESLQLVHKEIGVMKDLRGHPNIVTLHTHTVIDNGRTKECFLVMDYCEKTLVGVLDGRGAGFFEEKQLLLVFRDICNAVYAMHSQSPPVAHRDLKAENILLSSNGSWKLCDFGSISINHRRFQRAEEMGLEEDIIRKHTTPAYRAPEMWDLYRRELISEKVDIWALGCLLYRIAFFKPAFDGESKLQILNGNYRIPEAPRYSDCVTQLIRDMLMPTPESRPDILQVWNRVNEALPSESRKSFPDGISPSVNSSSTQNSSDTKSTVKTGSPPQPVKGVGSFWSTQYAADAKHDSDAVSSGSSHSSLQQNGASTSSGWSANFNGSASTQKVSTPQQESSTGSLFRKGGVANFVKKVGSWSKEEGDGDGYTVMSEMEKQAENQGIAPANSTAKVAEVSNNGAFNAFVAEFDSAARAVDTDNVEKLKLELKQALAEKAEFAGKYEKLTAICRSQRQEIQELKSALSASSFNKEAAKPPLQSAATAAAQSRRTSRPLNWHSSSSDQASERNKDKQNGSIWDLQSGLETATTAPSQPSNTAPQALKSPAQTSLDSWSAFGDVFKGSSTKSSSSVGGTDSLLASAGAARRQQHARAASLSGGGFGLSSNSMGSQQQQDQKLGGGFRSSTAGSSQNSRAQAPAGWAGF